MSKRVPHPFSSYAAVLRTADYDKKRAT